MDNGRKCLSTQKKSQNDYHRASEKLDPVKIEPSKAVEDIIKISYESKLPEKNAIKTSRFPRIALRALGSRHPRKHHPQRLRRTKRLIRSGRNSGQANEAQNAILLHRTKELRASREYLGAQIKWSIFALGNPSKEVQPEGNDN